MKTKKEQKDCFKKVNPEELSFEVLHKRLNKRFVIRAMTFDEKGNFEYVSMLHPTGRVEVFNIIDGPIELFQKVQKSNR